MKETEKEIAIETAEEYQGVPFEKIQEIEERLKKLEDLINSIDVALALLKEELEEQFKKEEYRHEL